MGPGILGMGLGGGTLNEIPPNASREEQIASLNDVIKRLNAQLKTQTFTDGTNKRYVNGYLAGGWPGGDFGLKISAPGYDVTDPNAVLLYYWDYTTNTQVIYNNGIPTILQGNAPTDGHAVIAQVKPGRNVLTDLQ